MPTPWTAETLWPAQGEQIVAASLLARKVRLEFELVARVILHQALHYILGSPESSGYPAQKKHHPEPNGSGRRVATFYELSDILIDKNLANTVFGPKQNADYWEKVFQTGKSPSNIQILAAGLDLNEMIATKLPSSEKNI